MRQEVYRYLEQYHMLDHKEKVLVGLSGGADSVCLLYLLREYAKTHPITVLAAHVHHGLRKNADLDEVFVRDLCKDWEIPFFVKHIDAALLSSDGGLSLEEAGRVARYEFFEEILKRENADLIATAHHRDDLCETMLFQLFRGSGIHGLHGILPVSGNRIRPLLCVGKAEIEDFLKAEGIAWRVDESNLDTQYARNRIRHEILPAAVGICPGAKENMAQCAERIRMAEEFLDAEVLKASKEVLADEDFKSEDSANTKEAHPGRAVLIKDRIGEYPLIVRQELVLKALRDVAGRKKDIGSVQVEAVLNLFSSQVGRRRDFIYGIEAKRTYEGVLLHIKENEEGGQTTDADKGSEKTPNGSEKTENGSEKTENGSEKTKNGTRIRMEEILAGKEVKVDYEGGQIHFRLLTDFAAADFPKDAKRRWFDPDKTGNGLILRHPVREDELIISRFGEHKPLYDFLKDSKVASEERDRVWVLADGNNILWAIGLRTGEGAHVDGKTTRVLEVEITGQDKKG